MFPSIKYNTTINLRIKLMMALGLINNSSVGLCYTMRHLKIKEYLHAVVEKENLQTLADFLMGAIVMAIFVIALFFIGFR